MSAQPEAYADALERAKMHALEWLASVPTRSVCPQSDVEQVLHSLDIPLPEESTDAVSVIDELVARADPGLMATESGRFFGWVNGGVLPVTMATDWLLTAWDQNTVLRLSTPATAALEETAARWLRDLLDFPRTADIGFTTGATMASFVGLASGRHYVLDRVGWNLARDGLSGSPRINVFVGKERHDTIDLVLRYLGLGAPIEVEADTQGRIIPEALAAAMEKTAGPALVCLQAGNLHSGAFDPFEEAIRVAHQRDAWVHVDGAFGLWAAASERYRDQVMGLSKADSWATDAHKTLNVPYDCGVAIVSRPEVMRTVFGMNASYLMPDLNGVGDPFEKVPELSRRARGVLVWAALRALGRAGVVSLVDTLGNNASAMAAELAAIPGVEVLNDVRFTQICLSFGNDQLTRTVTEKLISDGVVWMSGSRWHNREVLRISVCNWATDADDVSRSVAAVRSAYEWAVA